MTTKWPLMDEMLLLSSACYGIAYGIKIENREKTNHVDCNKNRVGCRVKMVLW